ncbi:hypothetical protein AQ919_03870 [Burkholderia pseudomallei]|nr:hypothetical protein AQ919_03870 [Burkholderia pseudomallei]ONC70092.1 hypothetical protein AQ920_03530 [Burkholderia pseudomallei]
MLYATGFRIMRLAIDLLRSNGEIFFPLAAIGIKRSEDLLISSQDQSLQHFTLRYAVTFCQATEGQRRTT